MQKKKDVEQLEQIPGLVALRLDNVASYRKPKSIIAYTEHGSYLVPDPEQYKDIPEEVRKNWEEEGWYVAIFGHVCSTSSQFFQPREIAKVYRDSKGNWIIT